MKAVLSLKRLAGVSLTVWLLASVPAALGIDEFELDLDFLNELNRIELNDYAEMQLGHMKKNYPDQQDVINLESAKVYYSVGRSKDAEAALARIPAASPMANKVLLLRAQVYAARKQWDKADAIYRKYFQKNARPESGKKAAQEEYKRAVLVYNHVLKSLNRPKEATRILERLSQIKGSVDERQMACLKLQTAIDTEAAKQKEGRPVDVAALNTAIKDAEKLQFIRDGVGATASIQNARAYVVRGRDRLRRLAGNKPQIARITDFAQAVKLINMVTPFLEELEDSMHGKDNSRSPMAEAMFYKAIAFAGHAAVTHAAGNMEKAENQIKGAARYLEKMMQEYDGSPLQNQAITEHAECSKACEKWFGEKIPLKTGGGAALVNSALEKADAFLVSRKYRDAYPFCLQALRAGRTSKKLPEVGVRTIMCLAEMGDYYGAEAVLGYMSDVAPTSPSTADAALRLGAILMNKSQKAAGAAAQEALQSRAFDAWDKFVDADPAHPKAPAVAYTIAENAYNAAARLAKKANATGDEKQKRRLQDEARKAFTAAIPKYQRMLDVFSSTDKGARALYKLGWIYEIIEEPMKAVAMFQQYYETEENVAKYGADMLEGKFRAGYLTMYGEEPQDAARHYQELIRELSPGGGKRFAGDLPNKARILEDSHTYLPWCFDLQGEKLRPQLTDGRNHIRILGQQRDAIARSIKDNDQSIHAIENESRTLAENFSGVRQTLEDMNWDFAALARRQLAQMNRPGDGAKVSEAERQMQEQTMNDQVARQAANLEKQKVNECTGNEIAQNQRRERILKEKKELEDRLALSKANLKDEQQSLARIQAAAGAKRKRIADHEEEVRRLERERVAIEADVQTAEKQKTKLAGELEEAPEAGKAEAEARLQAFAAEYDRIQAQYNTVQKNYRQITSPAEKERFAAVARELQEDDRDLVDSRIQVLRKNAALAIVLRQQEANAAELLAAARNLALTRTFQDALAKPAAERDALLPELRKNQRSAIDAEKGFLDAQAAVLAARAAELRKLSRLDQEIVERLDQLIRKRQQELKPVEDRFDHWKELALKDFERFLALYPDSKKAPENMARMGTIYLERNDSRKASEILERLTRTFPDSDAARSALFTQGRALAEAGRDKEAVASFRKMLKRLDEVPYGNLAYISDVCQRLGASDVVVGADTEILRRFMDPRHPDHPHITPNAKDKALFSLAQASLRTRQFGNAVKHAERLLKENPRTGYFYDLKFILAEARTSRQPPEWDKAEKDLGDVLQFADSAVVKNKANSLMADAMLASGAPEKRSGALSCYQMVAVLGDPTVKENLPWIENALLKSARIYAEDRNEKKYDEMKTLYYRIFKDGRKFPKF